MPPHLWRFWYQWLILSPGIGYRLHRSGKFVPKVLVGASTRREAWDEATLRAFADNLAEPARARAAVQMYRVFNLREAPPIMRGRYAAAAADGADAAALRRRRLGAAAGDARRLPAPRRRRCRSSWSRAAATSSPTSAPSWSPSAPASSSPR